MSIWPHPNSQTHTHWHTRTRVTFYQDEYSTIVWKQERCLNITIANKERVKLYSAKRHDVLRFQHIRILNQVCQMNSLLPSKLNTSLYFSFSTHCFVILLVNYIHSSGEVVTLTKSIKENKTVLKGMVLYKDFCEWEICSFIFSLGSCKRPNQYQGVLSCLLLCACHGFLSGLEPIFYICNLMPAKNWPFNGLIPTLIGHLLLFFWEHKRPIAPALSLMEIQKRNIFTIMFWCVIHPFQRNRKVTLSHCSV